jgi:E3 ubiquitin-protein ligase UBR7
MAALARLPRAQALDGVRAFGALQAQLTAFLRPFAQEGRVVGEADVRAFFAEQEEARQRAGA